VDISISNDDKLLRVNTFMDGKTRLFDISNPKSRCRSTRRPPGAQVNMVSSSWDGKRLYYSSSLLANWDKKGQDNEQFLKLFTWDGKELKPSFAIDFTAESWAARTRCGSGAHALYSGLAGQSADVNIAKR
jgi:selenium-binding protein 1